VTDDPVPIADAALRILEDAGEIVGIVFVTMVAVDLLETFTHGLVRRVLGRRPGAQYFLAAAVAAVPGCTGVITNVSLYRHSLISFGALAGGMIAGVGDEGIAMLDQFPRQAMLLIGALFGCGILFGVLVDRLVPVLGIKPSAACEAPGGHHRHEGFVHYLKDHVWGHVVKKHLLRTAAWTVGALVVVEVLTRHQGLTAAASGHPLAMLFVAALLGLIPESGPHMVFVMMYAAKPQPLIPMSVLFTSAFIQDGHGMLPLLSYSWRDVAWIKGLNLAFGLAIGLAMYAAGW
jgi:hypothetical protein